MTNRLHVHRDTSETQASARADGASLEPAGETVRFAGGGFLVTDRILRTPRKSYVLERIEYISVERPLALFLLPPALGLAGFAVAFHRYLWPAELVFVGAFGIAALIASLTVGTLKVHSLALRDQEVASNIGLITTLRRVRQAVEMAMAARGERREDRA